MIVCKYKFDKSIYSDLIPVFNDGYTGYTVSDVTEGNIITRTIECDTLPTVMRFGENTGQYEDSKIGAKAKSLKEVLYADISSVIDGGYMFGGCINLTKINIESWNNSLTSINCMFFCCKSLVNLDVTSLVSDMVVDIGYAFYYCAKLYNLTGLESWDTSNVTNMANMFQNCTNLTSLDVSNWDTSNVTRTSSMFQGCNNLTTLDISKFNTSNVTDMGYMFSNCKNLTSLDVSNWDTSNVTTMYTMFANCHNLTSLDVSNFNTSNVTTMESMFDNCTNLTSLDVSKWNTSNVTNMNNMFSYCRALTSIDANNWDTSNVTDMSNMFYHSDKLTTLDISNWNVGKVTNMATMFGENAMLQSLDLSNWDTSKVTSMFGMFFGCYALTSLDVSNFDTSVTTNMKAMFGQMRSIKTLNLNNIKAEYSKAVHSDDDRFMINNVNLEKIYLNDLDTLNTVLHYITDRAGKEAGKLVTSLRNKISEETLTTLTTKNWEIVDIVAQYRYDANTYENLIPEFNTEFSSDKYEVNDSVSEIVIDNIKWEEGSLNQENGENHNRDDRMRVKNYIPVIPNVTYKEIGADRFSNVCWYDKDKKFISYEDGSTLTRTSPNNAYFMRLFTTTERYSNVSISAKLITRSIESKNGDLPTLMRFGRAWISGETDTDNRTDSLLKVLDMNTSELTSCNNMFRCNKNLTSITCNWDIKNVTTMTSMFSDCYNLTSLDVSNFDTSNVTNMEGLFYGCNKLTSLDVSNFNTSNVTNMYSMFSTCKNLTSLDVSNFNTSNVIYMGYMFRNCKSLTSLDISKWDTSNVTSMEGLFYGCNKLTSLDVSKWNTGKVGTMKLLFYCCSLLKNVDVSNWDTSKVTDMWSLFYGCDSLASLDINNWDVSKVKNMAGMFSGCIVTTLDISNWRTDSLTTVHYNDGWANYSMFNNCSRLETLILGEGFNTSKVTNMRNMFSNCTSLTSLDVSNFDTSKVTTMQHMFYNCTNLTSLDVSNWDTSKVTDMRSMFDRCVNLTSLDVSNWDVSNVTGMQNMFLNCRLLTSLDVSNWDTKNVTIMEGMFAHNNDGGNINTVKPQLKSLNLSKWNLSNVNSTSNMFALANALTTLDIGNWDTSNVTDMTQMFSNTSSLQYIRCSNVSTINTLALSLPSKTSLEQGILISDAELSEETIATLASKNWTVVSSDTLTKVAEYVYDSKIWRSMIPEFNSEFIDYFIDDVEDENGLVTRVISSMGELPTLIRFGRVFADGETATDNRTDSLLEILNMNTSGLTNCDSMFRYNTNLTSITCNWDTSNVTTMHSMFANCHNLTSLDLSNFNTSNVTIMYATFSQCHNLTSLDVSNWNTSKVTRMESMFYSCKNLTTLDLSNFDSSNVNNMGAMFRNCKNLTSLDLSNFDTSNVITMTQLFRDCTNLTSLDVSNWDTSEVVDMYTVFYNCISLTSLDISNWDTSSVTDMSYMFHNTSKLSDIGMLYCSPSTINTLSSNLPTTHTQTVWVKDTDVNKLTSVNGVEFKEYKENSYMINLSSPLLNGDRIEVVDGKLCHYHKMGMVVFDGSNDEEWYLQSNINNNETYGYISQNNIYSDSSKVFCNTLPTVNGRITTNNGSNTLGIFAARSRSQIRIRVTHNDTLIGVKQWLSENPTTVVYELAEPYYEDITPLQSDVVLETYLECNLDIYTKLPIKANVSYITNVPSLSTLSMRATEMKESDNIIANLTNMLDNEINE